MVSKIESVEYIEEIEPIKIMTYKELKFMAFSHFIILSIMVYNIYVNVYVVTLNRTIMDMPLELFMWNIVFISIGFIGAVIQYTLTKYNQRIRNGK